MRPKALQSLHAASDGGIRPLLPSRGRAGASRAFVTDVKGSGKHANLTQDLVTTFQNADSDGNGWIDRKEFASLTKTVEGDDEYVLFHWLTDGEIDAIFTKYASPENGMLSSEAFEALAEDGVLLEGRLAEYRDIFESCASFQKDEDDSIGSVSPNCIKSMAARLDPPLTDQQAIERLEEACLERGCSVDGRVTFADFLALFREHMLDLQQITEYLQLEALPTREYSQEEVAEAEAAMPECANGIYKIESSEAFDALCTVHSQKLIVLLAGLSWCRPCKALTRPLEKLSGHYGDGLVVCKMLGDTNDNTKRFFKHRLKVRATPHVSFYRHGAHAAFHTGANKTKLENGIRRFWNSDNYALPSSWLYPDGNDLKAKATVGRTNGSSS